MAKARTFDRRRRSVRSIRKVTRTMELIASARFKKAMDRATAAAAFTKRIIALTRNLARSGLEVTHPLLEPRPEPQRALMLVLTANRGLCGGYNSGVARLAMAHLAELRETVPEVTLEISGKRGISAFRFHRIPIAETYTQFEDRPRFDEVDALASRYLEAFLARQLDRLDIVYTKFESASRQAATVETLLPLATLGGAEPSGEDTPSVQYDFLPSARSILEEVVPASFKVRLFKCFLDAAVSEQIARRIAMKAATENADKIINSLSMAYNRARQGQITGELLEILGGAEALNK